MAVLPADVNEFSEETRRVSPTNFLMKIESFSLLSKRGINKYESRSFDAGGYKWKLIMNFEENEGGHVSVYFSIAETASLPQGWEVNALFTFFIHNQLLDYYHCFRGMTRSFNAVSPKWGFSKFMSMNNLINPNEGYIVDDSCVFGAEVFVINNERINECLSLVEDSTSYKRDWKISDFSKLKDDDVWKSEEFEVGDHRWKVELYPKGNGLAEGRYISIFVECVNANIFAPHHKVKAKISMRIKSKLNDNKHAYYKYKFIHWFTSSYPSWGYDEFIPIADMTTKGFLTDDCCYLEIQVTPQALTIDAPKI